MVSFYPGCIQLCIETGRVYVVNAFTSFLVYLNVVFRNLPVPYYALFMPCYVAVFLCCSLPSPVVLARADGGAC